MNPNVGEDKESQPTSVSKSMLRILSASSMTRYFRARREKPFVFSMWSINRPGVAVNTYQFLHYGRQQHRQKHTHTKIKNEGIVEVYEMKCWLCSYQ